MIDLHQHSSRSDGTDNPSELLCKNIEAGVTVMALTDHDTDKGFSELLARPEKDKIKVIKCVEFSTDDGDESVHILALGIKENDPVITEMLVTSKALRVQRVLSRVDKLKEEFGITLPGEYLDKINASDNPNKPMLANMLISLGYGENINEVIAKYLYHKFPSAKLSSSVVVQKIACSSAVPVLAHGLGGVGEKRVPPAVFEDRVRRLKAVGLVGIECFYSLYDKAEQDYLCSVADKFGLLKSGGSDYHGTNKSVRIGELSSDGTAPDYDDFTILSAIKNIF